ncbi:MAG: HDOD domain-containing protein [Desulfobacteraceae bacterium]|nr:MAG: HDOD domain-containing protein [Desulfobacteraceae bacterium]
MTIRDQILEMVKKKDSDLPSLPAVIDKIISVASDPKTTTEELAEVISYDQGMTNKLIKLANSVYYAQKTRVDSIKRAITVVGFDEIIGIALGMSILQAVTDKTGMSLDLKALWIHGIGVATASKSIAKRTNPGIAGKVFIPALLHDMGKVIFSVYFRDDYRKVRQLAIEQKHPLYFAESTLLKVDHAMMAALLMKRWRFPDSILMPCRFHHTPESCPAAFRHQALILNLADYLTQKAGIGHSGNPVPVAIKNVAVKVGLKNSVLKMILDQLKTKEDEIRDFFNITTE